MGSEWVRRCAERTIEHQKKQFIKKLCLMSSEDLLVWQAEQRQKLGIGDTETFLAALESEENVV
jgi:hypothetical protein